MNITEYIKALTYEKTDLNFEDDEIKCNYSQRTINRWISMSDPFIPMVNNINKCMNVPDAIHFKYLLSLIPQRKQYFEYIKKEDRQDIKLKKMVARYFECNIVESEDYLKKLSHEQIQQIIDAYKYGVGGNKMIDV